MKTSSLKLLVSYLFLSLFSLFIFLYLFIECSKYVTCCWNTRTYPFFPKEGSCFIVSTRNNCYMFLHLMSFIKKGSTFISYWIITKTPRKYFYKVSGHVHKIWRHFIHQGFLTDCPNVILFFTIKLIFPKTCIDFKIRRIFLKILL